MTPAAGSDERENPEVMDDLRVLWREVLDAVRRQATAEVWIDLEARIVELGRRLHLP